MIRRVLGALAVAGLVACGGSSGPHAAPTTSSAVATSTTAAPAPSRPFTVTRRDVTVDDTSRGRTLPVMLLVPDGPGPFPLFEFSHGVTASGPAYEGFLKPIAAAGYVVAAPTFPLTSGPGGWSHLADYANQPADVYFVIDSVLKMSADAADPLHGKVDGEQLAIGGHSLGAMTTIGAAFNSCCAQPRVRAAVSLAGVEATFGDGTFDHRPPVPLLLAHGDKDKTVPVSGSDDLFAHATGPTAFVRYPDGTHSGILANDDGTLLDRALIAWLDKWLRNDPAGFDALPAVVQTSAIATLTTKNL